MERLCVTALMRTPIIIGGGYLTFDALLGSLLFEDTGDADLAHANIPIKKTNDLYHASAAILEPLDSKDVTFIAALRAEHTLDPDLLKRNKHGAIHRKISRQRRSQYGLVLNSYRSCFVSSVNWFVEGEREKISELISATQFIGKRRGSGYGEVREWQIEPDELDGIVGIAGEPLRPVPLEMFEGDKSSLKVDAAWRPPYWLPENRTICFAPELVR